MIDYKVVPSKDYDELLKSKNKNKCRPTIVEKDIENRFIEKGKPEKYDGIKSLNAEIKEGKELSVKVVPNMTINGTDYTLIFTVPKTVSIQSVALNKSNHLIIKYSDGSKEDAGLVKLTPDVQLSVKNGNAITREPDGLYVRKVDEAYMKDKVIEAINPTIAAMTSEIEERITTIEGNVSDLQTTVGNVSTETQDIDFEQEDIDFEQD